MYEKMLIVQLVLNIVILTITAAGLLVKPFRESLNGAKNRKETDRCLLRNNILATYYRCYKTRVITHYEYDNVAFMYKQYKVLGGNSFVDKIWEEMQDWEITQ